MAPSPTLRPAPEPPEREALPASKDKKLKASRDPNIPHPGRTFHNGQWKTPEQIKRDHESAKKYRENNAERIREKKRADYQKNPEPAKARAKAYNQNNPELVRERARKHYLKNYDRIREKHRKYYFENREKLLEGYREKYHRQTWDMRARETLRKRRSQAVHRGRDESKLDPRFANHIQASIDVNQILEGVMGSG